MNNDCCDEVKTVGIVDSDDGKADRQRKFETYRGILWREWG